MRDVPGQMSKEWTKEAPEPPPVPPSDWYWYWDKLHSEPWIVEIWPKRYIAHMDGLWGPQVTGRPSDPPGYKEWKKKSKKDEEEKKPPKPKRKVRKKK